MSRRHNLRLLHGPRTYTALELAAVLKINLGTVRRWTKLGLKPIDRKRPYLYLGQTVAEWRKARDKPHRPLGPGELLCVRCNGPRRPTDQVVVLVPRGPTTVDFSARCADCGTPMFRRTRIAEIADRLGDARIAYDDREATVPGNREPVQMSLFGERAA